MSEYGPQDEVKLRMVLSHGGEMILERSWKWGEVPASELLTVYAETRTDPKPELFTTNLFPHVIGRNVQQIEHNYARSKFHSLCMMDKWLFLN